MWNLSHSMSTPQLVVMAILHFVLMVSTFIHTVAEAHHQKPATNSSPYNIPAIFVFGDSTVDSGNNNYISTASKSNFPPYGRDFPGHIPTGRFTNGRLVTDFIGSYIGLKDYIPPYLDPNLTFEDLKTGVCFASAGTGFDPLTAQLNSVISIPEQLKYFKEYIKRMEKHIGTAKVKILINKSVFLLSAGTNDWIVNYYALPIRRQTYTVSAYQQFLLNQGQLFIQSLLELGVRTIAIVGLPPMGCVPAVITIKSDNALFHRGCIESLSHIARTYNHMLQANLQTMQHHGAKLVYVDIYKPLDDMTRNPLKFGYDQVNVGCCGSGLVEAAELCNEHSFVCPDASKFLFWDSVHPTELGYSAIFDSLRPVLDDVLKTMA